MRRQITPDRPEPADRGLLGKAKQQGLQTGAPMPSFHALPTGQGIDYHQALEDLGVFRVNHPHNVSGRQSTAIATICLLVASACSKATPEDRIKDMEDSVQELQRDAEDLVKQRDEMERRIKKIRDEIARERNEILQETRAPAPPAPDKPEPTPPDREAENQKNLAAIKQATKEAFPEGSVTAEYYILPILQKMIEAEYNDQDDRELDGKDWQYANFAPENKQALLDLIGNDRRKLEKFIVDTFKVIANLPLGLQCILANEAAQTIPTVMRALAKYKKYKKILDHHGGWLKLHGDSERNNLNDSDITEKKLRAYRDPCGNPKLHLEYEGSDDSWSIGRAPLDPKTRLPVQTKDVDGKALYEGEYIDKPFIRAIHSLAKRFGISTVEGIFRDLISRIDGLHISISTLPPQQ